MQKNEMRHTFLTIKERNKLLLNGVTYIAEFDENYIALDVGEGRIGIEGVGLKIESLSRDGGEIEISGMIDGVFYHKEKKTKSFLKGLFG